MAYPFGGHVRFSAYLAWAREQGCEVNDGVDTELSVGICRIVSPDKTRWVIVAGTHHNDFLVPTTVGRLDRRLGLVSPFFSIDDGDPSD